ncbi:MAG: YebC/PmpR family DNA-binding transcriptional regulator [Myxococcales bacterium]|jgi:YebC/PmpR family DNA-binding regulatory protein|nr:YebC/PmpR family DNA-binding transcriptional regulator [Myxococcales bacterium]
MSGHNRWTKIKRQKEAMGASKGNLFTKVIKEITVAARTGGGDPDGNARLRSALLAAKAANMPNDTIQRAIRKGTGELEGVSYEEITYEGYGPGGVAVIVECLTDNRNRTFGEVRSIFTKGGGNIGEPNSVSFMFDRRGVITVTATTEDALMETALEAGALDISESEEAGTFEVLTEPTEVHKIAGALEKANFKIAEAKTKYLPQNTISLDVEKAPKMLKLFENLEDNDDVQNVYANFEIDDAVMEQLGA